MQTDILDQSEIYPKIKRSKYNTVYYSHSIYFYNTKTELQDIIFLKTLKRTKIINPNGLGLGKEMIQYLFLVERSDAVWFRGDTIGVILECLSALAMNKPVYSLQSKDIINDKEIQNFVNAFVSDSFFKHDLERFKAIFTNYYDNLINLIERVQKL